MGLAVVAVENADDDGPVNGAHLAPIRSEVPSNDRLCEVSPSIAPHGRSATDRALADVDRAAAQLSARTGSTVRIGYITTARPSVDEAIAGAGQRVTVASWLLAPGLFHRWLTRCGADVVADPIGAHPLLVNELAARYRAASARRAAVIPT